MGAERKVQEGGGWEEGFTLDLDSLAAIVELQRQWAGLRCPSDGGTCELCTCLG